MPSVPIIGPKNSRASPEKHQSGAPVETYRPRFVLWTSFLAQLPLQLFFSFWAGGFVGGLLHTLLPGVSAALSELTGSPFKAIGVLVLIGFPLVSLSVKALNYANTTYQVLADRLVIEEGFLTQHRKEIALSSIREVSLRRSVLQRMVGLGSVYVATQATGTGQSWSPLSTLGGSSTFGSGAMLTDLVEAEKAYASLTELRKGLL